MRGSKYALLGLVLVGSAIGCGGQREDVSDRPEAVAPAAGWFPVGPAPLDEGQVYGDLMGMTALPVTGRASVIAVNPFKPGEVFLGTASGGLFHTNNATSVDPIWVPAQSDVFKSLAIGAVAVRGCSATTAEFCTETTAETCGCNEIWVGTGENGRRRDTHAGAGVYRYAKRGTGEIKPFTVQEVAGTATAFKGHNVFKILPESMG